MKPVHPFRAAALALGTLLLSFPIAVRAQGRDGPIRPPVGESKPTQPTPVENQTPQRPISVETTLVNLDVLVTDEDGLVLAGLKKQNFRVLDEDKPQQVESFEPVGAPITIVMLLEYSGNAYDYFAYKSASWGAQFLGHLEPKDYVALVTYDIKPTVRVDFTRNKAEMQQALSSLSYPQFHEANLFDAVIDTLERLQRVEGKTAILLVGTGLNTMSESTLDDTFRRIRQSNVTIFSVGVAEGEFQRAELQMSSGASLTYYQAKNQLQAFARMTGGIAWFPRFEGEIPSIFRSVATFLRSQYRIGFNPANLVRDGKYHKMKVEIVRPDGSTLVVTNPQGRQRKVVVYTREGYTAPGGETGK